MSLSEAEAEALRRAGAEALVYRSTMDSRPARPAVSVDDAVARFRTPLAPEGMGPVAAIDHLVRDTEGALHQMAAPTFFGYVLGGSDPVGVAADMLVSAWGQNAGSSAETPAVTGMERAVCDWLVDLLGLPPESGVGLCTGATLANTSGIAAARNALLAREGWDVEKKGLFGAPEVTVLIGAAAHSAPFAALRYVGFGAERVTRVPVDAEGRIEPQAFAEALEATQGPVLAILQAGQIDSGAFDPFAKLVPMARERRAWVHVDGAFGLWLAAVPELQPRLAGVEEADSWAVDLHKWLNAPFDAGAVICRDRAPLVRSMSARGAYLPGTTEHWEPTDSVFELSRRARGVPSYAILRALGRSGIQELVARHCRLAERLAARIIEEPGLRVMNEIASNQVAIRCGTDAETGEVLRLVQDNGRVYPTHGVWHGDGGAIIRASIIGYAMQDEHIDLLADEIIAAWRVVRDGLA